MAISPCLYKLLKKYKAVSFWEGVVQLKVNRCWVISLLRYLEHFGEIPKETEKLLELEEDQIERSLTEVQVVQLLKIAEEVSGQKNTLIETANNALMSDYHFVGMLISCIRSPLELLVDQEFMRKFIMEEIQVFHWHDEQHVRIRYSLPDFANELLTDVLAHFLIFAGRYSRICSEGRVFPESLTLGGKHFLFEQDGFVTRNTFCQGAGSECILTFNKANISVPYCEQRYSMYQQLKTLIDNDERYALGQRLSDRVKWLAYHNLENPDFSHQWVARKLGMCERKLQKALKDQGTSYRTILQAVRRDLAQKYLLNDHLSVTQTGFKLGYTETSNFIRAYKRWWGHSPLAHC